MSAQTNESNPAPRKHHLVALDHLCDAFESQWQGGARPAIEEYLSQSDSELRAELFEELLALEIAFRGQQGDAPTQADYVRRFPEFETLVKRVFSDIESHQDTRVDQETLAMGIRGRTRSLGTFGAYKLLEEIGRGGMGVVFKAYQPSLDRTVAIKMILDGHSTPQTFVQRFRTEAKTLAKLLHPGIVPIFEVGDVGGQHYFSMEFVEGETLSQRLAAAPLAPREAARLTRDVAEVIHFAHEQGILHRDIKPSNILVSPQGRTRVMDFGLAKQVEGDSQNTRSGEVLGTPSYMSPEQASGRWREVDRRSDVYSLGAVLYALLVQRPPFQGDSPLATLLSVVQTRPVEPRALNSAVEPDLERICMKCLEKDPARRYPTAAALAEDLEQYLKIDPTVAVRSPESARHSIKRPKLLLATAAAALALLAVVITFQTPHGTLVVDVPDNVAANLQVLATKDGAVEVADSESMWKVRLKEGKYDLQLAGGDDQFQITADSIVVTRNKKAYVKIAKVAPQPTNVAPQSADVAQSLASVKTIIPADAPRPFANQERLGKQSLVEQPAEIKNVLSWTIETTAHRAPVTSLAYHPASMQVVSCGRDGTLRIWDVATGRMQRVLVSSDELESCDVSQDGNYIAACGGQKLEIWGWHCGSSAQDSRACCW